MKVAVQKKFLEGFVKQCRENGFNELQTTKLLEAYLIKEKTQEKNK